MRLCTMVKFCINRKYDHNTINSIKSIKNMVEDSDKAKTGSVKVDVQ